MSVEEYTIYQGDTGPIIHARPSNIDDVTELDTNWHCYIAANNSDGEEIVAKREITDKTSDNLKWLAALTPTETNLLLVSDSEVYREYNMIVEVTNSTIAPPFNIEKHYILKVKPQGIDPV